MEKIWSHADKESGQMWIHQGRNTLCLQFVIPKFNFHIDIGEESVGFALPGLFVRFDCWTLARRLEKLQGSFSFYWFEGGLWFCLWADQWSSSFGDAWWRRMYHFDVADFVLGKAAYSSKELVTYAVSIPLPEGTFPGTVTLEEATWKRPRWKAKIVRRADISVERPPTFPGKGENSWDQGDDAIYSMTCRAKSVAEAIGQYVEAVLSNRFRRGKRDGWCKVVKED